MDDVNNAQELRKLVYQQRRTLQSAIEGLKAVREDLQRTLREVRATLKQGQPGASDRTDRS